MSNGLSRLIQCLNEGHDWKRTKYNPSFEYYTCQWCGEIKRTKFGVKP